MDRNSETSHNRKVDPKTVCVGMLLSAGVLTAISGVPAAPEPLVLSDHVDVSSQLSSAQQAATDHLLGAALVSDVEACKPTAPVMVTVTSQPTDELGAVGVEFTVEPMESFSRLVWTAQCRGAVQQLDGPSAGSVTQAEQTESVRLALVAGESAAFEIRIEGELANGEVVALRRTVRWGADDFESLGAPGVVPPVRGPHIALPTRTGR